MGAWSHEPFGNDDAGDWAVDLEETKDLSLIEEALDNVLEADDDLDAPEASIAIAAIEVMAKLLGKGTQTDGYTEEIDEWVKSVSIKPSAALIAKANRALDCVLGEDSELRELWEEGGADEWLASVNALRKAIS